MSVKSVLKGLDFTVGKIELKELKLETDKMVSLLREGVKKIGFDTEVFVGGSFAKKTLAKSEDYDVDIFMRFNWKYGKISEDLEKILKKSKVKYERLHGSRDYFRVIKGKITFEIIPVTKIRKVREARNVTDLSYFHVNYVKRNLKGAKIKDLLLAKKFCKGIGVYGAESYIGGFSGYGLECLMINYGSFEKMLKELVKVKERLILDPARLYKKKDNVLIELNESKLHSPIILVDPTWKDRNILAALSHETFHKFQKRSREFLKRPSEKFFEVKEFNVDRMKKEAKKKKAEYVHVNLETNRQEGDIAGTKMKKFSRFMSRELERYFKVSKSEFVYQGGKSASFYLIAKSKKEVFRIGPPLKMKKAVVAFRKKNKNTFVKNGLIHSKIKINFKAKDFLKKLDKKRVREMGIVGMKIT